MLAGSESLPQYCDGPAGAGAECFEAVTQEVAFAVSMKSLGLVGENYGYCRY